LRFWNICPVFHTGWAAISLV